MPVQLTFLSDGGYFFDSTIQTYWTDRLDPVLKAILKGTAANTPKVEQLLCLETVVQPNGLPASFICYRDATGDIHTRHTFKKTLPKLAAWIDGRQAKPHSGDRYRISLGPNGQFFAFSDCGYRWHGVSNDFQEDIQGMMAGGGGWRPEWEPDGVLFGIHDSYLITCERGKHIVMSENFQDHYKDLYQELRDHFKGKPDACGYDYITINPYAANEWLVLWNDDGIAWNLSPRFAEISVGVKEWLETRNVADSSMCYASSASDTSSSPRLGPPKPGASELPAAIPIRPASFGNASKPQPSSFSNARPSPSTPIGSPSFSPVGRPGVSSIARPPDGPAVQWGRPQHLTARQMMQGFKLLNNLNQSINNNMGSGGGGGVSFGGLNGGLGGINGSGFLGQAPLGGALPLDPTTALAGVPIDPSTVLGAVGMDPGSLMSQGVNNCSVM